jgi:hypothetical protein
MAIPQGSYYAYEATIQVGIWVMKGGAWQRVAIEPVYVFFADTTAGTRTYGWNLDGTYQLGSGVQRFGLSIEGTTGTAAAITSFTNAMWQAQGSTGGQSSATPSGQKSTVTVRP